MFLAPVVVSIGGCGSKPISSISPRFIRILRVPQIFSFVVDAPSRVPLVPTISVYAGGGELVGTRRGGGARTRPARLRGSRPCVCAPFVSFDSRSIRAVIRN